MHQLKEQQQRKSAALCCPLRTIQHGSSAPRLRKGNLHHQRKRRRRTDSPAHCVQRGSYESCTAIAEPGSTSSQGSQRTKPASLGGNVWIHANHRIATFCSFSPVGPS
uniref:(northern house mosquito) hypothetical protein n=1 Tax=Culex pipiens TaxID=7175 RepID=A0A8D8FFZ3_CULPI